MSIILTFIYLVLHLTGQLWSTSISHIYNHYSSVIEVNNTVCYQVAQVDHPIASTCSASVYNCNEKFIYASFYDSSLMSKDNNVSRTKTYPYLPNLEQNSYNYYLTDIQYTTDWNDCNCIVNKTYCEPYKTNFVSSICYNVYKNETLVQEPFVYEVRYKVSFENRKDLFSDENKINLNSYIPTLSNLVLSSTIEVVFTTLCKY